MSGESQEADDSSSMLALQLCLKQHERDLPVQKYSVSLRCLVLDHRDDGCDALACQKRAGHSLLGCPVRLDE